MSADARAPGARAPRPCAGARRARSGRRAACRDARCRRTRTGRASGSRSAKRIERTPLASIATISPGSTSRTKCAPTMSSARGLAREHPAALGAAEHERTEAVAVAHAEQVRFVHQHERERAGEPRQHLLAARCSRSRPSERASSSYSRASSSPISSLSDDEHAGQHAELARELLGVREVAVVPERRSRRRRPSGTPAARCATCSNRSWSSARARSTRCPSSGASWRSSNTCVTRPMSLTTVMVSPSLTAMPADSWPAVLQRVQPEVRVVRDRLARVRTRRRRRTRRAGDRRGLRPRSPVSHVRQGSHYLTRRGALP